MRVLNDIEEMKGVKIDHKSIKDHKLDSDDVQTLTAQDLKQLDIFTRYEKSFPFYKMNINGYMFHIKHAIQLDNTHSTSSIDMLPNIDYVS